MNSELGLQISVSSWRITDTAAFGITVTSVLSPKIIYEAGVSAGVAEAAAELRKHKHNNTKCLQNLDGSAFHSQWKHMQPGGEEACNTFLA